MVVISLCCIFQLGANIERFPIPARGHVKHVLSGEKKLKVILRQHDCLANILEELLPRFRFALVHIVEHTKDIPPLR